MDLLLGFCSNFVSNQSCIKIHAKQLSGKEDSTMFRLTAITNLLQLPQKLQDFSLKSYQIHEDMKESDQSVFAYMPF